MTRVDLVRLAALAAAATPGPWEDDGQGYVISAEVADAVVAGLPDSNADTAFIAACDPGVVAALVEAVQAAREYMAQSTTTYRGRRTWNALNLEAANRLLAALAVFGDESPEAQSDVAQSAKNADVRGGEQP